MLNRRIIEQNTVEPTNYTIIYKYVLNKLGGLLSYVEFDVANCVSWILLVYGGTLLSMKMELSNNEAANWF